MSNEDFETVRATVQLAHKRYALADGTERQALEALDRLESQNQALQEQNRKLELQRASAFEEGRKRGKFNRSRNEEARKRALQERAEKAEAALAMIASLEGSTEILAQQLKAIATHALSPTQETDPE